MRIALLLALSTLGEFSAPPPIRGLWLKDSSDPREFRFYYFHTNSIGLYRYGRRNLNYTNSYDYGFDGKELVLFFRKTGEERRVRHRFEKNGSVLVLENDPRESGPTRYKRIEGPLDHPFARMWTEQKKYATGGFGFRIYQFQPPDGAGRGRGWYHQGDYDDWSTEAFEYEKGKSELRFRFLEKQQNESTGFTEVSGPKRAIELISDPRNFWHRARFEDGGRSIIAAGDSLLFEPLLLRE
jgi:hypothetical protein